MTPPKVTVIMPAYNRAAYLREAIDSVLAQTLSDLELIVVDDGSTDETAALLAAVGDARLRCLRQEHRGVSAAVNRGLRAARGEYIARLDSDDVWFPETLQTLAAVLDARPEIGAVYAKGQAMTAGGKPLPRTNGLPQRFEGDSLRSLLYEDFTCNIVTLARRSCFERAGEYDESLPANEDWDMWLRIAEHDRFAFVDRILARFRLHEGNMTGPTSPLFAVTLETRTRPLDKVFARPDLPAAVTAMRSIAYENVYLFRCLRWLHVRDFGAARRELLLALRASDHPGTTIVRAAWFALVAEFLGRFPLGRRLAGWLSTARRRWTRRRARRSPH
jgi:glycosyltransferase involved in cell wall biosynthesis